MIFGKFWVRFLILGGRVLGRRRQGLAINRTDLTIYGLNQCDERNTLAPHLIFFNLIGPFWKITTFSSGTSFCAVCKIADSNPILPQVSCYRSGVLAWSPEACYHTIDNIIIDTVNWWIEKTIIILLKLLMVLQFILSLWPLFYLLKRSFITDLVLRVHVWLRVTLQDAYNILYFLMLNLILPAIHIVLALLL